LDTLATPTPSPSTLAPPTNTTTTPSRNNMIVASS
jgi:hypothetical protein